MAVTNEKDLEKERTMGRKFIVPYGLYRMEGFVSVPLAEKSGFADRLGRENFCQHIDDALALAETVIAAEAELTV